MYAAAAGNADVDRWLRDSFELAKDHAYAKPIGTGTETFALTDDYKNNAYKIAARQGALAGARLAIMLNEAFK